MRKGNWLQTFTGKQFWPLDPYEQEIDVVDIAASLSKQCRYAGHCLRFYSVAEHCVHLARYAPPELRMWALLHDASEAYLVDIPRPIKPWLENYPDLEEALMRVIAARFHLVWPMPHLVKEIDDRILLDEMQQNMSAPPAPWSVTGEPLGIELQYWSPEIAQAEFLKTYEGRA